MNENIYVVIVSGSTTIFYCAKFILFNVFALKRDKCCYPESFGRYMGTCCAEAWPM